MNHKIEIFSAGCPCCKKAIEMVTCIADDNDEIIILDMNDSSVMERAKELEILSVPTILIDGKFADCCKSRGPDPDIIRSALKH